MASYQWIKLYDEILDDPKMGRLSDGAYRFCINLFLLAGRQEKRDGTLPEFEDIAWTLRLSDEQATKYLDELKKVGIICDDNGVLTVCHFQERQSAVEVKDRVRQYRKRQQGQSVTDGNKEETTAQQGGNESVTTRYTDIDIEKDKEKKRDKYIAPLPLAVSSMITAIAIDSGVTYVEWTNGKEFEDIAYALIGNDITPDDVCQFGKWWERNGYYKGKPALKTIVSKIKAAKDTNWADLPKEATKASSNGHHKPTTQRPEVIDPTMPTQGGAW